MTRIFQLKNYTRGPLTALAVSAMLLVGSVSSADAWHRGERRHGTGILGGAVVGGALGAAIGGKKGILPGAVIGGAVGAATTSRAAPPPRPYYPPRPVYNRGLVYNIQVSLSRLGYNPGPIDGAYGQRTADAISSYEYNNQIAVTGQPSDGLYYHLKQAGG